MNPVFSVKQLLQLAAKHYYIIERMLPLIKVQHNQ